MPSLMTLGLAATSGKPGEHRAPVHPAHVERLDADLRARIFLERGYGERFGVSDDMLGPLVAGLRTREDLLRGSDVVVLPKPMPEDLAELRPGAVLWGWPHAVQDRAITQLAIDRRLTLIAWEAMHYWTDEQHFSMHVFHKNNEIAGYAAILHALPLCGITGAYGRRLRAAVISFGATARGAVAALAALGVHEINVLTQRRVAAVTAPIAPARLIQYEADPRRPGRVMAVGGDERKPVAALLAEHDVVVNCILQDTDHPIVFVHYDDVERFAPSSLVVDVSCDAGMGFEWARPTSFAEPIFTVGDRIHYYAVDHTPSYLWNSATWDISEALVPFVRTVMSGPEAWDGDATIRQAIEIRSGVVQNPKILSFQERAADYPHETLT